VWPLLLGVPGISLLALGDLVDTVTSERWVAKGACSEGDEERPGLSICWKPIVSRKQLRAQWLVAIHPDFASYSAKLGLALGSGGSAPPLRFADFADTPRYQYEFETWIAHSERVVQQGRDMRASCSRASSLLDEKYGLSPGFIETLTELVCALHDTGKLASEWQKTAWRWQDDKDARTKAEGKCVPERTRMPIAHTTFDPVADKAYSNNPMFKLPPHAVQGAYAVANLVSDFLDNQSTAESRAIEARSLISAIARHHGPRVKKLTCFSLGSEAVKSVRACLPKEAREYPLLSCSTQGDAAEFPQILLSFSTDAQAWPLYSFLVRRLRLADQRSLSRGRS
jgi:CRISPR-associated endonuclease/helicase Cas3